MVVGLNKVNYIDYFIEDQDSETEFDNAALDQLMSEDELVSQVHIDLQMMKAKSSKNGLSYYTDGTGDGGSDSNGGTLFKPVLKPEVEAILRHVPEGAEPAIGRGLRILDDFKNGTKIASSVVRRLSEGVCPTSGQTLNKSTKAYFDNARRNPEKNFKKDGTEKPKPRLGYDLTFSIDKAVSLLWAELEIKAAKGDAEAAILARKLENLTETSSAKAIQLAYDNDVIRTRRAISSNYVDPETGKTNRKVTEYSEPVADFTSALYLHKTARPTGNGNSNGDPQLHVHALLFNSVIRQDGSIGALDSTELYKMRPVLDGVFKAAFYQGLLDIEEFKHLDIIKKEKTIEIGGVSQELVQTFSARREEILDELEEMEIPFSNREAASIAAKNTRKSKDDQPPVSALIHEWDEKIKAIEKDGVYEATKRHQREVLDETHDQKLERLALETVKCLGDHQTIVSERDLLAEAGRACQGERGIGLSHYAELTNYIKDNHLIIAEPDADQNVTWAVRHLVEKEVQFLLDIKNSARMEPLYSDEDIDIRIKALEQKHLADPKNVRLMNEGQVGMYKYALSSTNQVICIEGSAGTGKTTTMQNINEAYKEMGFNSWGISPSWKAASGLGNELSLDPDKFFAVTKFINMLKPFTDANGNEIPAKVTLTSKDVIYVDEAGMLGIEDAQFLLKAVKDAGARMIMLGDSYQLAPVSAGDPLSMAIRVNGGYRLDTIVRQHNAKNEETLRLTARMREASSLFVESAKTDGIGKNTEGSRADTDNQSSEQKDAAKKNKKGDPNIAKALGIYREEGKILFEKDAKDTYLKIADRYAHFAEIENGNLAEVLVVTNRNRDVHISNEYIRNRLIKLGMLDTEEVVISAYRRDEKEDTIGHNLKIRAKERLIFGGKQIQIEGMTINNSDMCTVVSVEAGKAGGEPKLTLRFDKTEKHDAFTLTVTPSQLSAEDKTKDRLPRPVLQHAYAITVHASQGATVNRSIVANVNGIDFRLAYVGMTRHRHDTEMIVNTKRMEINALVDDGLIIREENGNLIIPHPEGKEDIEIPESEYKLTEEDYFNRIVFEASQAEFKSNFTGLSFYKDDDALVEFLDDDNRYSTHYSKLQAQGRLKEEDLQRKIIDNKARLSGDVHKIAGILNTDDKKPVVESVKQSNNNNTQLNTKINQLKTPTTEELTLLKGDFKMNYDLLDKISKDVSRIKVSDIKWTNELESQYRGEFENFLLAHGAVQNPKMRNKPHQLNLCDGISGGEGFNTFTFTLKEDGNWIYNQWNDSKNRGVLESFLVNKGICNDYKEANSLIADQFPLHHVRSAKLKGTDFSNKITLDSKPKDAWQAYEHSVNSQLAVTTFAPKYGQLDPIENLHQAIEESKLPSAMGDTIKRGQIAEKWLNVIKPMDDPNAKEKDKETAAKAYAILEKGGSFPEFEWKHKLENVRQTDQYYRSRAVETATMRMFEGDVKRYAFLDHGTGEWKDGLAFAHRHVVKTSQITGIEYKMGEATTKGGREALTSSFSSHPGKGVGMLGCKYQPETIIVCESGLDAMSHWQKNNLPADFKDMRVIDQRAWVEKAREENKTLYLSVAGSMSTAAAEALTVAAKNYPQAKFEMAFDNDLAGFQFEQKAKAAIKAGNPKAEIKDNQLPIFVKDWNDLLKAEAGATDKAGKIPVQWPADIMNEFVAKSQLNAGSKPYELTKLPQEFYDRFKSENLVKEAEAFQKSHPAVFEQMEYKMAEYARKSGQKVDAWKPEAFKDAGFTDTELAYVKAKYAEHVDKQQAVFTHKTTETHKPTTQKPKSGLWSGVRPDHLKPKSEISVAPMKGLGQGMPKPSTNELSMQRLHEQRERAHSLTVEKNRKLREEATKRERERIEREREKEKEKAKQSGDVLKM
ncbi:MobF family relaxase [Brucella gallinifaecis]|uniref:MobF family relaxase n=1 Tax=Brucella gallinifaecis TaxID=215590 RepID=UPI002361037F|nr:MobF family relaxase [Brucella gallinifaecis]